LADRKIKFFTSENDDIKASVVERVQRTLKSKIWRHFSRHNTSRYIDVLPDLVESYNNSYHRSIKRTPASVNLDNQEEVWHLLYGAKKGYIKPKIALKAGDTVRISKTRYIFAKGYTANWTEELFTVSEVRTKTDPVTYRIKDLNGEEIKGSFYEAELQKVQPKTVFRIEKIIKFDKRKKRYLIKWYGYDSSFNSWIPKRDLTTYTK